MHIYDNIVTFQRPLNSAPPLYREEARKEVGPDGQDEQPQTNANQHQAAPAFYTRGPGLERIDQPLLRCPDEHGQPKHEGRHDCRGHDEGDEGRSGAATCQRMPGQTGQDRAGSAEASQDIAEPKQAEGQRRALVAQSGLGLHEGSGHSVHSVTTRRDVPPLQQAKQKQQGARAATN
jgi:hypothetical protein